MPRDISNNIIQNETDNDIGHEVKAQGIFRSDYLLRAIQYTVEEQGRAMACYCDPSYYDALEYLSASACLLARALPFTSYLTPQFKRFYPFDH